MISKIIEFSIRNRFLVLLLTFALIAASIWGTYHLSLDAIPDLSDAQVIIVTNDEGQNPEVIDKQVTYPLASAMVSVPRATAVRGYSMFGLSFVYVLFEDGTDIYWARSRVLEYLNFAHDRLPAGVEPKLGPDATGVGWVYQYVLYPGYYCAGSPQRFVAGRGQQKMVRHAGPSAGGSTRQSCEGACLGTCRQRPADKPATRFVESGSLTASQFAGLVSALPAHEC